MPGEIAMVTGASSGLGEAYCRALAASCERIIAVARRGETLAALAAELAGEVELVPVTADLASVEGVARSIEALRQKGPVSVLVNNAGFGTHGRFAELPITAQQRMVSVHVDASLNLCRAAIPPMRALGRGAIINVASVTALAPMAGTAVYAASKAFLANFSLALQDEEDAHGIRVQCLCPGLSRTGFHQTAAFADFDLSAVPDSAWMAPEAVVTTSLQALADPDRQRVIVVPGEGNRQMAVAGLQRQLASVEQ